MKTDAVDDFLDQWSEERPELETESLGVVIRIMSLSRPFALPATGLAKETGLSVRERSDLAALMRKVRLTEGSEAEDV